MKAVRIITLGLILACTFTNVLANTTAPLPGRAEFPRLRWKGKTIRIALSSSLLKPTSNIKTDSDVSGAVSRSLKSWANVADIDLQVENSDRQSVSPAGPAGDGVSLITIAQTPENILFFAKDSESLSAKTRIFFNRKGMVTEADIVLNPFQQFSTDGTFGTFDLESTLTHEIGHLLGLRHSGVLGASMADSFAKNGTMGFVDFGPRTLAQSDIAAVRELYGPELYGPDVDDEECCSSVSGKILTGQGRPGAGLRVWAEESETGRVIAQSDTIADGTYRLGGLSAGDYSLYWKNQDPSVSVGELGNVRLEKGENKIFNGKVSFRPADSSVQFLGLNGRLADFSVTMAGGRSYLVNLGGKNLDARSAKIALNTPFIKISTYPISSQEFGEGVSGISLVVDVDPDIPAGQYSIYLTGENGSRTCLVGALNIE